MFNISPQAHRRLNNVMAPEELRDLSADIADALEEMFPDLHLGEAQTIIYNTIRAGVDR